MAGTSMELRYADHTGAIVSAVQRVMRAGQRTRPLMVALGEYVIRSTQSRFDAQRAPDGTPWAPVQPARMAIKRIKKILTESSRMRDSVVYKASDTSLEWGSNLIYFGIHQDGGRTAPHDIRPKVARALMFPGAAHPVKVVHHPGSAIPARPSLGISSDDEHEILARVHDYYQRATGG